MHHAVYHMPATKSQIFTMLGLGALGFRLTLVEFVIISNTILCKDWGLEKQGAWPEPFSQNSHSGGFVFIMFSCREIGMDNHLELQYKIIG